MDAPLPHPLAALLRKLMLVDVFIQTEDGQTRQERFDGNSQITLGRHTQCTLILDSDLVSRHHATMMFGLEAFRVEDTSSNGTVVGDVILRHEALDVPYGTPLVVGNYTMQVFPALAGVSVEAPALRTGGYAAAARERRSSRPAIGGTPPPPRPTRAPGPQDAARSEGVTPKPIKASGDPATGARAPSVPPVTGPSLAALAMRAGALAPPRLPQTLPRETGMEAEIGTDAAPTAPGHKDISDLRKEVFRRLREAPDAPAIDGTSSADDIVTRARVRAVVRRIVRTLEARLPPRVEAESLATELTSEAVGLGPIEELLTDPAVRGIVVIDASDVFVEREGGALTASELRFTDEDRCRICLERLIAPLGESLAKRAPVFEIRLADGTRVSGILPPVARRGVSFSLRRPAAKIPTLEGLAERGVLTPPLARFLARCALARKNILVSGPPGCGKSALVQAIAAAGPVEERVVTFEAGETMTLPQRHVVALDASSQVLSGEAAATGGRATLAAALRLRPDRLVLAALPPGTALDVLGAMSAGPATWLLELIGRTPREALGRFETFALLGSPEMPTRPLRDLLASALHVVVHLERSGASSGRVISVHDVGGTLLEGGLSLTAIFDTKGAKGELRTTGHMPRFLEEFVALGLVRDGEAPL